MGLEVYRPPRGMDNARMKRHIALLRGINVGKAKRVPMADLRALMQGLGHANVRTLLNSGNAVFDADETLVHWTISLRLPATPCV